MTEQNNGGPAFPFVDSASPIEHSGMSLRDYFAAKAMLAHITHEGSDDINEIGVARWAYEMADAMLEARK